MKTLYFSDRHAEILDFNRSYLQLKAFNIERLLALLKSSWILCFPEEIKTMFFSIYLFMFSLDAQRALELLQQYRAKLDQRQQKAKQGPVDEDHQLQQSLDKVINVFQSQLFSALLGKKICFGQL